MSLQGVQLAFGERGIVQRQRDQRPKLQQVEHLYLRQQGDTGPCRDHAGNRLVAGNLTVRCREDAVFGPEAFADEARP